MTRFAKAKLKQARGRSREVPDSGVSFAFAAHSAAAEPYAGEIMDLAIETVAPGGRALAHAPDGRVVFVDLGLPGQQVRATYREHLFVE